jgi:hypothetical protein
MIDSVSIINPKWPRHAMLSYPCESNINIRGVPHIDEGIRTVQPNIEENEEDHLLNISEANQESFPMAHRGCEKPQDEKGRYYVFIRI